MQNRCNNAIGAKIKIKLIYTNLSIINLSLIAHLLYSIQSNIHILDRLFSFGRSGLKADRLGRSAKVADGSTRLRQRRLTFVGHCLRSPATAPQPIADLLLWQPHSRYTRKTGRCSNYRKNLCEETGCDVTQLLKDATDRIGWRKVVCKL